MSLKEPLKILDYDLENSPFEEIFGEKRNLAWPVDVYRVTLPRISNDDERQNPFERVILKMIADVGIREAKDLAEETCIPIDFVHCIICRLQDKQLIDEYLDIVDKKWEDADDKPIAYDTMLLFREVATGKILPFLQIVNSGNPIKTKDEDKFRGPKIRPNSEHRRKEPLPDDVIAALRTMKNRLAAFGKNCRIPKLEQIKIAQSPELYHLDCPIAIQKSDGEFRIADPFGNGFSLVLESAFTRLLENNKYLSGWFSKWKNALSVPRQNNRVSAAKEPYDNDRNRQRYPKLLPRLRQVRSIRDVHAAIEWALFYSCSIGPFRFAVDQLKLKSQSKHTEILNDAAKNIGLTPPQDGFYPIPTWKLDEYLNGKAELDTVFGLAVFMASQSTSHPLRIVAEKHPDFVQLIFDIKSERNPQMHGEKLENLANDSPEVKLMRNMIETLLPGYAVKCFETRKKLVLKRTGPF